ncbi:MAG: hypothetical protein ACJ766_00075 [Thermoleophilaceae bacterium]
MARKLRDRLTYANVMATIAVFIALGGTGYAAAKINGKNIKNKSIAGKKLKNRTITRGKVKKNTLTGAEIAESRLGKIPNAADADNAAEADNATHADSSDTAGDASTIDGIDSPALARRSDGVGFLVEPSGWRGSGGTVFTGQTDFTRPTIGTGTMRLPLSYPTRSNGRPLFITTLRVCSTPTNATISTYSISTGSGESAANGGGTTVPSGRTTAGCDNVDMASLNEGRPFQTEGGVTVEFVVQAAFQAGGHVALGGVHLTLAPG